MSDSEPDELFEIPDKLESDEALELAHKRAIQHEQARVDALAGYRDPASERCPVCGTYGCETRLCMIQSRQREIEQRLDELDHKLAVFRDREIAEELDVKLRVEAAAAARLEVEREKRRLKMATNLPFLRIDFNPLFAVILIAIIIGELIRNCSGHPG